MGPLRKPIINRARPTRIGRRPLRGQLALSLRPRERLASRRRRARIITAVCALVVAAAGVWGAGVLSHNERLVIKDVSVSGTRVLSASAVSAAFETKLNERAGNFFSGINIFLYPKRLLEQTLLQKFPRLDSVSVTRESLLAQTVTVNVHEREARYRWCKGSNCYLMDGGGFIFALADGANNAYIFRGGLIPTDEPIGQAFLRGRLGGVLAILSSLEDAGFSPSGVTVENETDMQIPLREGYYLKVTFGSQPSEVAKKLTLALSSDALAGTLDGLEYVDLRFGNRVYYQLK